MSLNVYEIITDRIIQSLQQGVCPWRVPWTTGAPCSLISKRPYRGINVFLLNASRHKSRYWLTYKQATAKGGQVRKGEKSSPVIFWKIFNDKSDYESKSGKVGKGGAILRYYNLFNLSQVDGIEAPVEEENVRPFQPIEACEHILTNYTRGPAIEHGGNRACYLPSLDLIQMPDKANFHSPEEYYSTLFHEEAHATGAKSRLDREGVVNPIKFGSHDYSYEELVAEMTASFLSGHAGILEQTYDNSAAYLSSWISKLQRETRWIVSAGGAAAKAADFILQQDQVSDQETEESE
jgi:antirestriction protein ArdC